jgi:hypothetical protein
VAYTALPCTTLLFANTVTPVGTTASVVKPGICKAICVVAEPIAPDESAYSVNVALVVPETT